MLSTKLYSIVFSVLLWVCGFMAGLAIGPNWTLKLSWWYLISLFVSLFCLLVQYTTAWERDEKHEEVNKLLEERNRGWQIKIKK